MTSSAPPATAAVRDALGALELLRLPDGSLAGRAGEPARPDATAWAALAWILAGEGERGRAAGRALAALQPPDGRLSSSPLHPGASWPTPLAILAWRAAGEFEGEQARATENLLAVSGQRFERSTSGPVAIDSSIVGWPWVERTFSWVAPTALALLALRACGLEGHPRIDEGRRMLLDRQLPSGGWNYGNTLVFGAELLPAPEETALALAALAGLAQGGEVAHSLDQLRIDAERVRTPMTLGWTLLALSAWGERPPRAEAMIMESLARAGRFGGYDGADLALLVVAALAPRGLLVAVAERQSS